MNRGMCAGGEIGQIGAIIDAHFFRDARKVSMRKRLKYQGGVE